MAETATVDPALVEEPANTEPTAPPSDYQRISERLAEIGALRQSLGTQQGVAASAYQDRIRDEATALREKAAAVGPLLQDARATGEAFASEAATRMPQAPTLAAPPSRELRDFLAPIDGEAPDKTVAKFMTGVNLLAQGILGFTSGDVRGSLAALTGALAGWHAGDTERAGREFADWQARTSTMLETWKMARQKFDDWFSASKLTLDQKLKGAELTALEMGLTVDAAKLEREGAKALLDELDRKQKDVEQIQLAYDKILDGRATKEMEILAREETARLQREMTLLIERGRSDDREADRASRSDLASATREATASNRVMIQTGQMRDDFRKDSEEFVKTRDAYSRVLASAKDPSAAGDLSLIFNYMKMLDPGSVVRESEFAVAAAAGGYGERIQGLVQRAMNGQRFEESVRADFVKRSNDLFAQAMTTQEQLEQQYRDLAGRSGVPAENVVIDRAGRFRPTATPNAPAKESLSRHDPRYARARARGLTDAQIAERFGVRVAD